MGVIINMVDNQNKYNKKRWENIIYSIPALICSLFLPKKDGRIIINSHFNENFDFNSKYLFLYMLKHNYDVWYVINNDDYRVELENEYGKHFIETKSFFGKIFALRSKLWFVSAFELPVGGIFLKLSRKIIHLTHGSLIKNVGILEKNVSLIKRIYYKLFVSTNLSYSIATSQFFVPSTSLYTGLSENKILITGFPRNDALQLADSFRPQVLRNCGFSILYAPTWRKYADVVLFPFDDVDFKKLNEFLKENNITIFIRLHPYNENSIDERMLGSNIKVFSTAICNEIMDAMGYFDALITDYSSIYYDFLLLDRPTMFLPYDYSEYEKNVGFAVDYNKITLGYKPHTIAEFKENLYDMKIRDSFKGERMRISELCNKYKTNNCERLINKLYSLNVLQKTYR